MEPITTITTAEELKALEGRTVQISRCDNGACFGRVQVLGVTERGTIIGWNSEGGPEEINVFEAGGLQIA